MVLTAWTWWNAQHLVSSTHARFPVLHKGTLLKWGYSWKINVNEPCASVQQEPDCTSTPLVVPSSMTRLQATSVLSTGCFLPHWDKNTTLWPFLEGWMVFNTLGQNYSLRLFCRGMPHSRDSWGAKGEVEPVLGWGISWSWIRSMSCSVKSLTTFEGKQKWRGKKWVQYPN